MGKGLVGEGFRDVGAGGVPGCGCGRGSGIWVLEGFQGVGGVQGYECGRGVGAGGV